MNAEILSYSRNKGLFAGISLEGSTLRSDGNANEKLYGKKLSAKEIIVERKVAVPACARELVSLLNGNRRRTSRIRSRWSNSARPVNSSAMIHETADGEKRLPVRCAWAQSELMIRYHDEEWGVPVHDDGRLFEFLILEGAQAGLSWETILNKRENYRAAFDGFDARRVARYDRRKIAQLLRNPGIVRNRLKIASAVQNARALLRVQEEYGSFDRYVWQFVGGRPKVNLRNARNPVPARTAESDAMSKDLKKRGFNFVGSTICYAFMQAVGMVDDHVVRLLPAWQVHEEVRLALPLWLQSLKPSVHESLWETRGQQRCRPAKAV